MGTKKALAEAVRKAASGRGKKKIACAKLFRLAEKLGATLPALGKLCDDEGINIQRCQLGCFE